MNITDFNKDFLEETLCKSFCKGVTVTPVPCGFAVSTLFTDEMNDKLGFYIVQDDEGLHFEDDGDYLSRYVAKHGKANIEKGQRANFIDSILKKTNSYIDFDTYEIKSHCFNLKKINQELPNFVAALQKIRSVEYWTTDRVASTFKDDVYNSLVEKMGSIANIEKDDVIIDKSLKEFPCDIGVILKDNSKKTAIFTATSNEKLDQALLLKFASNAQGHKDITVAAIIESRNKMSSKKIDRIINRSVEPSFYEDDEEAAIQRLVGIAS